MNLLRLAILFYGCILLFSQDVTTFYYEQPLVEEGKVYEMTCTGNMSLKELDTIQWGFSNDTLIASCSQTECSKPGHQDMVAAVREVNRQIRSSLRISNVTRIYRGVVFVCKAFEYSGKGKMVLGVWNISRTFHPPLTQPLCQARLQDGQTIYLTCQAAIVYPDIKCETFQSDNGQETKIDINMIYDKLKLDDGYYSINCSAVIYPDSPGVYRFCVKITHVIGLEEIDNNNRICTEKITIKSIPTIRIFNKANIFVLCPDKQKSLNAKCELLWWASQSAPTFSWFLDNKEMYTDKGKTVSNNSRIESFFNLTPNYNNHKQLLKCQISETVSATRELNLIWPPSKPPELLYNSDSKANQTIFSVVKGEKINVQCRAEGGEPPTSLVSITCRDSSMSEIAHSERNNNLVVNFAFQDKTICSCTAQHISQCAISPVNITFVEATSRVNTETLIYSISSVFVCLVGLTVLIALIFYWRARSHESDIGWFSLFRKFELKSQVSSNDFKTKLNKKEEPYSVVDIVDQMNRDKGGNSLLFQTWHQDNYNSLSNHFPLSERPLPAPPPHSSSYYPVKTSEQWSGLAVLDTALDDDKFITSRSIMKTNIDDKVCLPSDVPPPLPPKPKMIECQVPDIPVFSRDNIIKLRTQYQRNKPPTNNCNVFNNVPKVSRLPHSVPRRRPPPVPCGGQPRVIDLMTNREHEFPVTRSSSKTTHGQSKDGLNIESKDFSRKKCQLRSEVSSKDWPPPPIIARKKTVGNKKSDSIYLEPMAISPYHSDLEKDMMLNTELGDMLKYSGNTASLSQDVYSSQIETFLHKHSKDQTDETCNDIENDECLERSLLSTGLSSSKTSIPTVINSK